MLSPTTKKYTNIIRQTFSHIHSPENKLQGPFKSRDKNNNSFAQSYSPILDLLPSASEMIK